MAGAGGTKGLKLLSHWASPYGHRVRIALSEKSVEEYESLVENEMLLREEEKKKKVKSSSHLKFPVLLHNGKPISDSLLVVQYIDETWPDSSPLLPTTPLARSRARFWADFIDKRVHTGWIGLWKAKGEEKEASKKEFIGILKLLESELGKKKYFGGETFGFVDIALAPFLAWFYAFETYGELSIEAEAPYLMAWGRMCVEMESVAKSLPEPRKVYELISSPEKCTKVFPMCF